MSTIPLHSHPSESLEGFQTYAAMWSTIPRHLRRHLFRIGIAMLLFGFLSVIFGIVGYFLPAYLLNVNIVIGADIWMGVFYMIPGTFAIASEIRRNVRALHSDFSNVYRSLRTMHIGHSQSYILAQLGVIIDSIFDVCFIFDDDDNTICEHLLQLLSMCILYGYRIGKDNANDGDYSNIARSQSGNTNDFGASTRGIDLMKKKPEFKGALDVNPTVTLPQLSEKNSKNYIKNINDYNNWIPQARQPILLRREHDKMYALVPQIVLTTDSIDIGNILKSGNYTRSKYDIQLQQQQLNRITAVNVPQSQQLRRPELQAQQIQQPLMQGQQEQLEQQQKLIKEQQQLIGMLQKQQEEIKQQQSQILQQGSQVPSPQIQSPQQEFQ
ncbi:uncharacterized protein TRIADDRAFT_61151 [Trichoplax adhaerens]|uniref:Uncharacterized protein n=1 Tax=Trichoplax adhaerens TaxID=10228 RepID=B3SA66_TRIAD|nr:predicted protein [Trichoplax adhaerens]EDV20382.1 predicted protein [Trichoplax adhaerens]|eukprot:XP_002117076.1 predicted protein [Trichoplax adhaerens]